VQEPYKKTATSGSELDANMYKPGMLGLGFKPVHLVNIPAAKCKSLKLLIIFCVFAAFAHSTLNLLLLL